MDRASDRGLVLPRLIATAWGSGRVHGSQLVTAFEDAVEAEPVEPVTVPAEPARERQPPFPPRSRPARAV